MADHEYRRWRLGMGASLRDVAEIVRVPFVRIHRWEMSKSRPSPAEASLWLAALKKLDELASRERTAWKRQ
jgi:transcriptional regulator with XRE-family HTH domain